MPTTYLSLEQFLTMVKDSQGKLTNAQYAAHLGITPSYLSDVYNGHRTPGPKLARSFKASSVTGFQVDLEAAANALTTNKGEGSDED